MGVVLFHLSGNLKPQLSELLPNMVNVIFSYGYLGVPIFFVISGFVISYSLRSAHVTGKYVGNFMVRRSIRLDLTYWASILLALVLLIAKNKVTGSEESLPSVSEIIIHMFYLQDLMRLEPHTISVVYWTLCLEVQFYLFYILLMWFAQKISIYGSVFIVISVSVAVGIYSIILDFGIAKIFIPGLFVSNWHYFLLGVLTSYAVQGLRYGKNILIIWLLIEVIFQISVSVKAYAIAGVCTSLVIYTVCKNKNIDRILSFKPILYLGAISYPLYLLHPDIGWKIISLGKRFMGSPISPHEAGVLLLSGIFGSIIAAHIFHVTIEKPTQIISTRMKLEPLSKVLREYVKPGKANGL